MPHLKYRAKRFSKERLAIIAYANRIIDEYAAEGFDLTLRQLYYQFVARDLLPNEQREYKRLGEIISDARMAGMIDWHAITDRTRMLRGLDPYTDPAAMVTEHAERFHLDLWEGQTARPEVWIEKDALVGVIAGVCESWDVDYFSCRGYTSQSEMWVAAQRIVRRMREDDQGTVIFHLGDHDPSGVDMTRDISARLGTFISGHMTKPFPDGYPGVVRLALNMDQIEEHEPPPNPAKVTDSRARGYIRKFGRQSWELDAMEPAMLTTLIETSVKSAIDNTEQFEARKAERAEGRAMLRRIADRWADVVTTVSEAQ